MTNPAIWNAFLDKAIGVVTAPVKPKALTLADLRALYRNDFLGFCAQLDIIPKSGPRLRLELNEIQRAYHHRRTPRDVVLKGRQFGFTTEEQARDLWHFLMFDGAAVVVVCQSSTDMKPFRDLSGRFDIMIQSLQANTGLALEFATAASGNWKLDTGATLSIIQAGASEAAAQKKGRAGTVHRLHCTELAFWEYAGETLNALLECVPGPEAGTEIVFESTPNGTAGDSRETWKQAAGSSIFYWFCEDARRGSNGYAFVFISWLDVGEYQTPLEDDERIVPTTDREKQIAQRGGTAEQIKWFRAKVAIKGQDQVDQEYPTDPVTCFLVSGRQFFDRAKTTALIAAAKPPLRIEEIRRSGAFGMLKVWAEPEAKAKYVIGADTSEGTGGDRAPALVYRCGTGEHVATLSGQFKPWELAAELARVGRLYNVAIVAVERNNHGHAALRALDAEQHYLEIFHDHDSKPGWITSEVSRNAALAALEQAHRDGSWTSPDVEVLSEFRTFVVSVRGKAEAARGSRDDMVMAAAIGWDVAGMVVQQIPPPKPRPGRWGNNGRGF